MTMDTTDNKLAPMDFSTFIVSLGSSVMVYLGQGGGPEGSDASPERNLPMARQTVDILAMLETKTAGNLTDEESKLLSNVLYQVRMACLEAEKAG